MAFNFDSVEARCEQVPATFPSFAAKQVRLLLPRISVALALIHERVQRASLAAIDVRVKTQNAVVF